jgi:hypothetical protein
MQNITSGVCLELWFLGPHPSLLNQRETWKYVYLPSTSDDFQDQKNLGTQRYRILLKKSTTQLCTQSDIRMVVLGTSERVMKGVGKSVANSRD